MVEGLENLTKMEYPGRFIILGRHAEGEGNIAIYGVTGRSPPSQARRFVFDEKHKVLRTDVTDKEQLEKGSPALLIYPAMAITDNFMLVSNGAQTNHMYTVMCQRQADVSPGHLLDIAFGRDQHAFVYDPKEGWIDLCSYEPDPSTTARVNGVLSRQSGIGSLGIVKCVDGARVFEENTFEFEPGQGGLIATYTGVNQNPLPPFAGEPLEVALTGITSEEIANEVYAALAPVQGGKDLRVAVACWNTAEDAPYIINRHDLETEE
ncbi:IMP cyclohydrolase [Candidatus Woesearchaeota archaeon]|nr:IMP cyclohydrolase [Candidatus Woesearchaeota archaeon]